LPRTLWCNSLRLRTYSPRALYLRSYVAPTFPTRWQRYCKIVGSRTATPARTSPWFMIRSACSTMFSGQPRSPSTCEHERAAARRWFGSLPAARVHSQRSLSPLSLRASSPTRCRVLVSDPLAADRFRIVYYTVHTPYPIGHGRWCFFLRRLASSGAACAGSASYSRNSEYENRCVQSSRRHTLLSLLRMARMASSTVVGSSSLASAPVVVVAGATRTLRGMCDIMG